jgi:cell division protein ZapA (FtsZ GTPase activity inhibitor)
MSELKKQTITIFDDSYTVVSDEPEKVFSQAVSLVNDLMSKISLQSKVADKKKVAVLSALHMAVNVKNLEDELALVKNKEQLLINSVDEFLKTRQVES